MSGSSSPSYFGNKTYLAGAALVVATLVTYLPALSNAWIWDDDIYVTQNGTLRTAEGLRRMWFDIRAEPQYYPLVFSSFWVEYHLWQLKPLGYHLDNVLLHSINAVLLWLVFRRIGVPGAWLAAAVFALHPVQVESVAWVSERKNVLSGFFYLSAALAYLRFIKIEREPDQQLSSRFRRRPSRVREDARLSTMAWRWYGAALLVFVCALLSKTITCSLPAALLLILWWKHGRIGSRDMALLLPFFILGVGFGLLTAWLEQHHVGAVGEEWAFSVSERLGIAGQALWFYAGKFFLPIELTFIYPRFALVSAGAGPFFYLAAAVAVIVSLWAARHRLGRGPLVAVLFFAGTLVPALGFFNIYPMRYSFVADHFQYLACIGLISLSLGAAARWIPPSLEMGWQMALAGLLLLTLAVLTWRQTAVYRDVHALWNDTLRKNPDCRMAYNNLGVVLAKEGKSAEAAKCFSAALRLKPDDPRGHFNLARTLMADGKLAEANEHLLMTLQIEPNNPMAHYYLGIALVQTGKLDEAIGEFSRALAINPDLAIAEDSLGSALGQAGRLTEAVSHFTRAVELDPAFVDAHANLVTALANLGKPDEAARQVTAQLEREPQAAEILRLVGTAFARQGRQEDAIIWYQKAIKLQPGEALYRYHLGAILHQQGQLAAADQQFQIAMQVDSRWPRAASEMARALAADPHAPFRNGSLALKLANDACMAIGRPHPALLDNLAAANAELGHFPEAIRAAKEALQLASAMKQSSLIDRIEKHLKNYEKNQPSRDYP